MKPHHLTSKPPNPLNTKPVERITRAELIALLSNEKTVNGCTFASFDALTEPDMNKTIDGDRSKPNPHFGKVRKVLNSQLGMLFSNKNESAYAAMVNRRKVATGGEADFVVQPRKWGQRIPNTSVVEHNGGHYLTVIYHETAVTLEQKIKEMGLTLTEAEAAMIEKLKRVVAYEGNSGEVSYVIDNGNGWEPIAKKDIIGLREKATEGKQGRLVEEAKVVIRDFKMGSIQRITLGGKIYIVDGE